MLEVECATPLLSLGLLLLLRVFILKPMLLFWTWGSSFEFGCSDCELGALLGGWGSISFRVDSIASLILEFLFFGDQLLTRLSNLGLASGCIFELQLLTWSCCLLTSRRLTSCVLTSYLLTSCLRTSWFLSSWFSTSWLLFSSLLTSCLSTSWFWTSGLFISWLLSGWLWTSWLWTSW